VGKAKSLRHRLGSYRVANPERMPRRTLRLLRLVRRIAWERCADERTALRREAELLLALRPRFNRAGVWPRPTCFLIWRALPEGLALALATAPEEGWACVGPMGGQAFPLHRALVRLLWCRLRPDRGLAGMPPGWFGGGHGARVFIPVGDSALIAEAERQVSDVMANSGEAFQQWLTPPASPFELASWQEDLLSVCESMGKDGHGTVQGSSSMVMSL